MFATSLRRLAFGSLLVLASFLLVACDDDGNGPGETPAPTLVPTATASAAPPATASPPRTASATRTPSLTATATPTLSLTPTSTPPPSPSPSPTRSPAEILAFDEPRENALVLAGRVDFVLELPPGASASAASFSVDGEPVVPEVLVENGTIRGSVEVPEGRHVLSVLLPVDGSPATGSVFFEAIELRHPDECEILNDEECLLPYPSSRFLEPADTPTGWRLRIPEVGMIQQAGRKLSPEPYNTVDGFAPTVQILVHFPGGVDPELSGASRLLPETRTYDLRSLDPDSPTVLLDAETGERILHFIEPDIRAADNPKRQVLFLRPATSLRPARRYVVAFRNLRHPDGSPVEAEPVFAALRDRRPSSIPALEARREHFEELFALLEAAGISRESLVLAFDFVTQSDESLTGEMLSMRDQAFAWLEAKVAEGTETFTVDRVVENECREGTLVWRQVEGTYEVPLFLTHDPAADRRFPGRLHLDEQGVPVQNGVTHPPFTIVIPCTALEDGGTPKPGLVVGHGLFGTGRGTLEGLLEEQNSSLLSDLDFVLGATDWWGLSRGDIDPPPSFIVDQVVFQLGNFPALPDRLRQGQLNTLVLARMMKRGVFNRHPAFQSPEGTGLLQGPEGELYYFGASLGGIMGLMFAALSPDVTNVNVDVPAMNFSILLQRATPFLDFELALRLTQITDPMEVALGIGIFEELWAKGESAGYATHITENPLPGTNPKNVLMTMAWLDQQVSNQATEIAARTLGLPNLEGSFVRDLPLIPDLPGPLSSALVVYDTGSFDPENPAHAPFIPPLANLQARPNRCDPHGLRGFIPASIQQLLHFFRPGGRIENFCNGICDAAEPLELPFGREEPCDPLAQ
ncbi:MAG: hypothetical protein KatS3mg076_2088 [Candidatus Binatia bacterium]|nr:MAG: hypothetical protein KatS3mg076_2088 [Candidatus Binatia bacterium]